MISFEIKFKSWSHENIYIASCFIGLVAIDRIKYILNKIKKIIIIRALLRQSQRFPDDRPVTLTWLVLTRFGPRLLCCKKPNVTKDNSSVTPMKSLYVYVENAEVFLLWVSVYRQLLGDKDRLIILSPCLRNSNFLIRLDF